ncbi:MAG: glycoside hydrolase family 127 protein [Eubacteriales bacterium]|nr:glycoside hydrolase family 127 protein [Eubacteriales bacterium]
MGNTFRPIELNQIKIADPLWKGYTDLVASVIIPKQWKILNGGEHGETPNCLNNFRIAAGELAGKREGVVFVDTDVYKWLETVSNCIANGSGKQYEAVADEVIALLARAQQKDGYLNTYYTVVAPEKRWTNLVEGHELYSAGYLMEAAVAYRHATGKTQLLDVACRFADLICSVFGSEEGKCHGYPGHQEIEMALIKLYRETGNHAYLRCARYFIENRGTTPNYFTQETEKRGGVEFFPEFAGLPVEYAQAHMQPKNQTTAEGHAVRCLYMCCAMADLAQACGDEALHAACRAIWENVTQRRMYITGGVGSSGHLERFTTDFDLPNPSGYAETCASIALAMFGERMAALEGNASYYDVVERALYNTVLSGISATGDAYFYVNPQEVWPAACMQNTSMAHVQPVRQPWFTVACCPPNVARTLASLGRFIYAIEGDCLYIHCFISSAMETQLAQSRVQATLSADMLRGGSVSCALMVEEAPTHLTIRIPAYARKPEFRLDGSAVQPEIKNSYAYFVLPVGRHTLEVAFHVRPVFVAADPRVHADGGKVALVNGPCVYCLEEADNGCNLHNIAVEPETEINIVERENLPPVLTYAGWRVEAKGEGLYRPAAFAKTPVTLTAVPYGVWGNRGAGEMLVWQNLMLK